MQNCVCDMLLLTYRVHHGWLFVSHLQQQCGIHPQKGVLLWELWTQHHMPRDPREVLPTYSSVKTLIPAVDPLGANSPSQTQSRSHGKHCLRKSLTDKRVFMEVQVWCEVPTHYWSKKIQIWMHWKGQLVKTREGRCSLKCKDSNSKLIGTWKISETWYHQWITIIL